MEDGRHGVNGRAVLRTHLDQEVELVIPPLRQMEACNVLDPTQISYPQVGRC